MSVYVGIDAWWITMVDATLVRHHQGIYDKVMAAHAPADRRTLAGLRFVRNQIGRGASLGEAIDTGAGNRRITSWTWKPVPESVVGGLPPRAQDWELARYRAYQASLAGMPVLIPDPAGGEPGCRLGSGPGHPSGVDRDAALGAAAG